MCKEDLSELACVAATLFNACGLGSHFEAVFSTAEAGNGVRVVDLDDKALDRILDDLKTKPTSTGKKKSDTVTETKEALAAHRRKLLSNPDKESARRYSEIVSQACLDRLIDCKGLLELTVENMAMLAEQKTFPVERERFYANFNRLLNVQRDIEALIKDWK